MKVRYSASESELLNPGVQGTATAAPASSLATESLLTPPRSILGRTLTQPARPQLKIVILGPSLAASLGNGAASTYRGLVRELVVRGHDVLLLERANKGSPSQNVRKAESGRVEQYLSAKELQSRHATAMREADFVLVASQIAEAADIGEWVVGHAQGVTAFYDLNTPQTVVNLRQNRAAPISAELMSCYDLYLSFTGGPLLNLLEDEFGLRMARPLYPAADARLFFPENAKQSWDLGYIGRRGNDTLPVIERLLLEPARRWKEGRFIVAGSSSPRSLRWPGNVRRTPRISQQKRRAFYNSQRFMLDITPSDVAAVGYSPGARLFEAAACGTPVITEFWPGLDKFFTPDEEILISHSPDETLIYLEEISELERRRLGYRARERVLARHTSRHRAAELEGYVLELLRRSGG
jgi:spore maturation protein CgeB